MSINYSFRWRQQIIEDKTLSSTTKLVAMILHYHMDNKTGECFPSEAMIAKEGSLTERCVVNHIKKLKQKSHLLVRKEKGGQGWNRNCYKGLLRPEFSSVSSVIKHEFKTEAYEYKDEKIMNVVQSNSPINSSENSIESSLIFLEKFTSLYPTEHQEDTYKSLYSGWLNHGFEKIGAKVCNGLEHWIINSYFDYCYKMSEKRFLMEQRWNQTYRPSDDDIIY